MKNIIIHKQRTRMLTLLLVITLATLASCEKFVSVDKIDTLLLSDQVFESDAMATAAITGLYKDFRNSTPTQISVNNASYADETMPYLNSTGSTYYTNRILPNDTTLPWNNLYAVIYAANNAIEKLTISTGVSEAVRDRSIAEAKFMRALCYFYLINLFGDVPLALTSDLKINGTLARTDVTKVYQQIINDLLEAKSDLGEDYSHAANERVKANKWVAGALLARVYLFTSDFTGAESEANTVINSGKYSLLTSPAGIWGKNNSEAMLQLANNPTESINAASSYIYTAAPFSVVNPILLNAFETGDLRKSTWIQTKNYAGQPVSIPFKMTSTAANPPEYYTLIRLAEMYLIRAETKAMRGDFQGSVDDVNLIRLRHGGLTSPLQAPATQAEAITLVLKERQVDLFTEGCHRFFDLKRLGRINAVMTAAKPAFWNASAALYPIPLNDMQRNPNLTQNPGYE